MYEFDLIDCAIEELQEISLVDDELDADLILDKLETAVGYIQKAEEYLSKS